MLVKQRVSHQSEAAYEAHSPRTEPPRQACGSALFLSVFSFTFQIFYNMLNYNKEKIEKIFSHLEMTENTNEWILKGLLQGQGTGLEFEPGSSRPAAIPLSAWFSL